MIEGLSLFHLTRGFLLNKAPHHYDCILHCAISYVRSLKLGSDHHACLCQQCFPFSSRWRRLHTDRCPSHSIAFQVWPLCLFSTETLSPNPMLHQIATACDCRISTTAQFSTSPSFSKILKNSKSEICCSVWHACSFLSLQFVAIPLTFCKIIKLTFHQHLTQNRLLSCFWQLPPLHSFFVSAWSEHQWLVL